MSNEVRRDYSMVEQPRNPMGVHQPVVLCIDTSGSMNADAEDGRSKIQIVEEMVNELANVKLSDYDKNNVDICVLSFDDVVRTVVDWRPLSSFDGGVEIDTGGLTSLGSAVLEAIEKTRERRAAYAQTGIQCKRAQIFIYTDGASTEPLDAAYARSQEYLNREKPSAKMYITLIPPAADPSELLSFGEKVTIIKAQDCVNGLPATFEFMQASIVAASQTVLGGTATSAIPNGVGVSVLNKGGTDGTFKDADGNTYVEDTVNEYSWY